MGCPESVVNSRCRSGLFSSAGTRVFFSQASSLSEVTRWDGESARGISISVLPFRESFICGVPALPGDRPCLTAMLGERDALHNKQQTPLQANLYPAGAMRSTTAAHRALVCAYLWPSSF